MSCLFYLTESYYNKNLAIIPVLITY